MKWNTNDINFRRGNYDTVICKLNNSPHWYIQQAMMTTQTARSLFRKFAKDFEADRIELKYLYDENDIQTETDIIEIVDLVAYGKGYEFRKELNVPEGQKREFTYYNQDDLFKTAG